MPLYSTVNPPCSPNPSTQSKKPAFPSPPLTIAQSLIPDILSYIFYLSAYGYGKYGVKPSPTEAPMNLLRVCRHWNRTARDDPLLWAGIFSQVDTVEQIQKLVNAIYVFFTRSATAPVSFDISCDKDREGLPLGAMAYSSYTQLEAQSINALMQKWVLPLSHRWRDVRLEFPPFIEVKGAGPLWDVWNMPLIEVLQLSLSTNEPAPEEIPAPVIDLSNSQFLRELYLRGEFELHWDTARHFEHLQSVEFKCQGDEKNFLTIQELLNFLRSAPNLAELKLYMFSVNREGTQSFSLDAAVVLEHLRFLRIEIMGQLDVFISTLLANACFPSLADLQIVNRAVELAGLGAHPQDNLTTYGLPAFLRRSRSSLSHLRIEAEPLKEDELIETLRLSPDLRTLVVMYPALLSPQTLLELTLEKSPKCMLDPDICLGGVDENRIGLCPKLDTIVFRDVNFGNAYEDRPIGKRLIASRWTAHPRWLKRVCIDKCGFDWLLDSRLMKKFVSEGLILSAEQDGISPPLLEGDDGDDMDEDDDLADDEEMSLDDSMSEEDNMIEEEWLIY